MPRFGQIDLLNQRRQRRGLPATGRAADQDQSVVVRDEFLQVGMKIELLDGRLEGGEQPDGEAHAAGGLQDVDPAPHALDRP